MRVIAGAARGHRLQAPPGRGTRPTPDRVREALFSTLFSARPGELVRARVLDLFAGSGALGIEALSRGAVAAVFVESDARAAAVVRANLASTGLSARATVVHADANRFCAHPRGGPFDLVLADPPYALRLGTVRSLLRTLSAAGGVTPNARVVVERDRRDPDLPEPDDTGPGPPWLAIDSVRHYGDSVLLHAHLTDEDPGP